MLLKMKKRIDSKKITNFSSILVTYLLWILHWISYNLQIAFCQSWIINSSCPWFFDQVGHLVEISIFSLNHVIITYQNYELVSKIPFLKVRNFFNHLISSGCWPDKNFVLRKSAILRKLMKNSWMLFTPYVPFSKISNVCY